MAKLYKETAVTGSKYTRANQIVISNDENQTPFIYFNEENVVILDAETKIKNPAGGIRLEFNQETANTSFDMLNPETGDPLGASMTYQELYVALYSLYIKAATDRDAVAEALANPPQANTEPTI